MNEICSDIERSFSDDTVYFIGISTTISFCGIFQHVVVKEVLFSPENIWTLHLINKFLLLIPISVDLPVENILKKRYVYS